MAACEWCSRAPICLFLHFKSTKIEPMKILQIFPVVMVNMGLVYWSIEIQATQQMVFFTKKKWKRHFCRDFISNNNIAYIYPKEKREQFYFLSAMWKVNGRNCLRLCEFPSNKRRAKKKECSIVNFNECWTQNILIIECCSFRKLHAYVSV